MQKMAQDSSTAALTFLKLCYNIGYKIILTEFGRQETEMTRTIDLVAAQRAYRMAPDVQWPKTLELIDGTTIEPLIEEQSDQKWAYIKSGNQQGRPTHFHYLPRFGVGGGDIELYPIPSSSTYDLKVTYEATDKDLSQAAYSAGTITLALNSAAVVGASTTFTTGMAGRYLIPTTAGTDQLPYRILTFTDTTHLTLETQYVGPNANTLSYKIVELPNLPQDMHVLPCYWALEQWWSSKGNAAKTKEFGDNYIIGMARAKKTHSVVTRNNIIEGNGFESPFPTYPFNFPMNITE